jgi:hypothetical protein
MSDAMVLLEQWLNAARIAHIGHSRAAAQYSRMHLYIGLPVTVLAAAVGSSVFASVSTTEVWWAVSVTGVASIAAAILSALQTFLNYSERAAVHAAAAAKFGALRRRIEVIIVSPFDQSRLVQEVQAVEEHWKTIDEGAPVLAQRYHDLALKIVAPRRAAERVRSGDSSV